MNLTPAVLRLVDLALEEDVGRGDVTSDVLLDPGATVRAALLARERLVLAGGELFAAVFRRVDARCEIDGLLADGAVVEAGRVAAYVSGPARAVLAAERTALNFVQRLSGIATITRAYVDVCRAASPRARVVDTRKTAPGMRLLEKRAVLAGGGANHRFDLASGVLIKDNHVAAVGGVRAAVERARERAPHPLRIEVEVGSLPQLDEALAAGADAILLDNMDDAGVEAAVARARGTRPAVLVEVSGGVTLERVPRLARAGVDLISVGALTHSARAVDLSLEVEGSR